MAARTKETLIVKMSPEMKHETLAALVKTTGSASTSELVRNMVRFLAATAWEIEAGSCPLWEDQNGQRRRSVLHQYMFPDLKRNSSKK